MKRINSRGCWTIIVFFCFSLLSYAQYSDIDTDGPGYGENCTTIMVGRLASTDGSVMTSHTCDGNYRTWLEIFPHQKYENGVMHKVYENMLHSEEAWDMTKVSLKGEIPDDSRDLCIPEYSIPLS